MQESLFKMKFRHLIPHLWSKSKWVMIISGISFFVLVVFFGERAGSFVEGLRLALELIGLAVYAFFWILTELLFGLLVLVVSVFGENNDMAVSISHILLDAHRGILDFLRQFLFYFGVILASSIFSILVSVLYLLFTKKR